MDISTQLLTHYTQYAIMSNVHSLKGGIYAGNAREILDAQGVSRTLQGVRGNDKEIHQEEATQGYSHWRQFTSCRYCLARIYQQAEQVASPEALNVKSHCHKKLSRRLRQWLRKQRPRFYLIVQLPLCQLYDINQHKTTLVNIVNDTVGGKCVVL